MPLNSLTHSHSVGHHNSLELERRDDGINHKTTATHQAYTHPNPKPKNPQKTTTKAKISSHHITYARPPRPQTAQKQPTTPPLQLLPSI
ncbi:uncharacterized protein K452DRAFT_287952 [Aplosporella prunicola CBS 121167]|uniref:Uncharacterized protein n=1 Tax=Aplosporella prunicola CBS 121167 TaxID=1176127 RepID=A0A6A6BAG4_9PEZI|nr:uncharacterized protein K452DRAFT_287952 [Aplosporella prunicola CBS 121167]KAF2141242.1 hypothetical protein K452DRAFT_287952 [Aplosporella prunicola CBS 121167]